MDLKCSMILLVILNLKSVKLSKFPSQEDFDYIEDLITGQWKTKETFRNKFDQSKATVKIGSYAPSASHFIENVDSDFFGSPEPYYQPSHDLSSIHQLSTVNYQPPLYVAPSYPKRAVHHYPPYSPDHHYYHHHHHGSHHSDHSSHGSTHQQELAPTSHGAEVAKKIVRYVPVPTQKQSTIPTSSPWLWSLLFVIIFPTLLGAILLPLALVFLTNVIFVLLMVRNNNQNGATLLNQGLIPSAQNKRPRNFTVRPHRSNNQELIFHIYSLLIKSIKLYGSLRDQKDVTTLIKNLYQ